MYQTGSKDAPGVGLIPFLKRRIAQTASDFEALPFDPSRHCAPKICRQGFHRAYAHLILQYRNFRHSLPRVTLCERQRVLTSLSHMERQSISRRTTVTPTAHTLDGLILFQLRLWYSTDAGCIEICFLCLYASEAAQLQSRPISAVPESHTGNTYFLVPLFLPFGNQIPIRITVLK